MGDHDSFLDMMTNVVGILIIVAMVIRVSVGGTMTREVRLPEEERGEQNLGQLVRQRTELSAQVAALTERKQRIDPAFRQTSELLLSLAGQLEASRATLPDRDHLQAEVDQTEAGRLELEDSLALLERRRDELDREYHQLKAALEEAVQAVETRPSLKLPRPDPLRAEGRIRKYLCCRRGQIYILDHEQLRQRLYGQIESVVGSLDIGQIGQNLDRVFLHFKDHDIGNELFRLDVVGSRMRIKGGDSLFLKAVFSLREGLSGISPPELQTDGEYLAWQGSLDPARDWIYFLVWDDLANFRLYETAREQLESQGFAVGWEPFLRGAEAETVLVGGAGGGPASGQVPD